MGQNQGTPANGGTQWKVRTTKLQLFDDTIQSQLPSEFEKASIPVGKSDAQRIEKACQQPWICPGTVIQKHDSLSEY